MSATLGIAIESVLSLVSISGYLADTVTGEPMAILIGTKYIKDNQFLEKDIEDHCDTIFKTIFFINLFKNDSFNEIMQI